MFVRCECCVLSGRGLCDSSREFLPTVGRRCVWSRNLEFEEAKTRYRAMKNRPAMGCNARKTNKQCLIVRNLSIKLYCIYVCYTNITLCDVIQGDSGGICNTLGNDRLCDYKQKKSSYEHGSDFERLPRYGKKKIRTILRARSAIT